MGRHRWSLVAAAASSSWCTFTSGLVAPPPQRFLVLRHGETDYNLEGRVQGTLETQMTPEGHDQARALGRWLGECEPCVARVAVSPKLRTRETLAGIVTEHPVVGKAPTTVRPGLREIELTVWEGRKVSWQKAQGTRHAYSARGVFPNLFTPCCYTTAERHPGGRRT